MRPIEKICVIGGTGFIGGHLAEHLVRAGYSVTLPTRHRETDRIRDNLLMLPLVDVVEVDVHDPATLAKLLAGHDAVINLVGILHGSEAAFQRAHVTLVEKIVAACQAAGIERLLHMSALGASATGPSQYQRSKAAGEAAVRASGLQWTIFRPSVVFGEDDAFTNKFAALSRRLPLIPMVGAGSKVQPVWVEDVARAFVTALTRDDLCGQALNLVGPTVYTLAELIDYTAQVQGKVVVVMPLPNFIARPMAQLMALLPNPALSPDNLDSLSVDNVDPAGFPASLGYSPTPLEAVLPGWLVGDNSRRRLGGYRSVAHR